MKLQKLLDHILPGAFYETWELADDSPGIDPVLNALEELPYVKI